MAAEDWPKRARQEAVTSGYSVLDGSIAAAVATKRRQFLCLSCEMSSPLSREEKPNHGLDISRTCRAPGPMAGSAATAKADPVFTKRSCAVRSLTISWTLGIMGIPAVSSASP